MTCLGLDPTTVNGDPVLLEQLLHNLVRNAVAYNVDGGRLEVTVRNSAKAATLRVGNDGRRVTQDEAEALLARFHRGPTTTRTPGFGLGLSIVDTIATAHRATLTVGTRPAGGLNISVTFPHDEPDA